MKVGELYDTVENTRFQVVKHDLITQEEIIVFDDRGETMREKGLDEQIEHTEVDTVYSYFDYNEGEVILQAHIF